MPLVRRAARSTATGGGASTPSIFSHTRDSSTGSMSVARTSTAGPTGLPVIVHNVCHYI